MEPIKDTKFDVDKMINEIIDHTELFLLGVKEIVKSGKDLEEEKFITYWFSVMNLSNMSVQQGLFFTHLVNYLYEDGFFKSPASRLNITVIIVVVLLNILSEYFIT